MGTTQTALRGTNPTIAYVLVVEGYPYLLTSGLPAAAVTAWAGTKWTQALPGLQVSGTMTQSLAPWSNEVNVPRLSFSVLSESTDQFGIDMFKAKPSVRSELTTGFGTDTSSGGSFDINVQNGATFASASYVYIGNEAYEVTGTPSGTTISIAADGAGIFSPFGTNTGAANTFPGPHSLAADSNVASTEASTPVHVTDAPATWIGKKVGLYIHKIDVDGGAWDVKAQAELWFAGTIANVFESGLATIMECDGIQQALEDATIMADQWQGRLKEGKYLEAGDTFGVTFKQTSTFYDAATLTVVASGAGADQINAGYYTADAFAAALAQHLDEDSTLGRGSTPNRRWSAGVVTTENGPRFVLQASGSSVTGSIWLYSNSRGVLGFLGFDEPSKFIGGRYAVKTSHEAAETERQLISDSAPFRIPPIGAFDATWTSLLTIEDSEGSFFDHTALLPPSAQNYVGSGETWSFFTFDDETLFLGRRDSATQISGIHLGVGVARLTGDKAVKATSRRIGDDKAMVVKQVFSATGTFCSLIAKLFASVDGQGTNHATYDVFPWGAGIPWGLLGQNFLDSLTSLEQSGAENSLALIVEKPTRLWDLIRSDFALRMASPMWKDGGLQIVALAVPNASTADHTLDETNKSDTERSTVETTSEFLAHTLKVEINRQPLTDKYTRHLIARDVTAYQSQGGAGATKTIKARNSYVGIADQGSSAEALVDVITANFLPVFAKPLKRWRRSINHRLFHMTPGDTATLSDNFLRDPSTGIRGVTNRPCTVLSVSTSFGIASGGGQTYMGEVDLLYTEEDRAFPISPTCEHAFGITSGLYSAGYDSTNDRILVHQHKFSDSAAATDFTHFAVGDEIELVAMDPADPAAAATHTDVIESLHSEDVAGYDGIQLTTGFTPTAGITYLINFDDYDTVGATQQLVAFQADATDGEIGTAAADPNTLADASKLGAAAADLTLLPARYAAEQYGDGQPLSAGFVRDMARMSNNLINYKTAPHMPFLVQTGVITSPPGTYETVFVVPYYIGEGRWPGALSRKLNVAPRFRAGLTLATCRVTSSGSPPDGDTYDDANWHGPTHSVEFTTASLSYVTATSQELQLVRSSNSFPGVTWLTIEGKSDTQILGLAELWLGPLA